MGEGEFKANVMVSAVQGALDEQGEAAQDEMGLTTPGVKNLLREAAAEVDEEQTNQISATERKLHTVAQRLLLLERDLKAPGAARSVDERAAQTLS